MAHKDEVTADRRSFLKMASVGTLASSAAAITGGAAQATEEVEVQGSVIERAITSRKFMNYLGSKEPR